MTAFSKLQIRKCGRLFSTCAVGERISIVYMTNFSFKYCLAVPTYYPSLAPVLVRCSKFEFGTAYTPNVRNRLAYDPTLRSVQAAELSRRVSDDASDGRRARWGRGADPAAGVDHRRDAACRPPRRSRQFFAAKVRLQTRSSCSRAPLHSTRGRSAARHGPVVFTHTHTQPAGHFRVRRPHLGGRW